MSIFILNMLYSRNFVGSFNSITHADAHGYAFLEFKLKVASGKPKVEENHFLLKKLTPSEVLHYLQKIRKK